ncbi:lysostaphin resistance A-like protein [Pontiella sp.]|uniref:CPBP family intramembrane glutamic endopeptidase n=1 Tax=Pontiella sp. TaxID=2837462 RepID=UPI00356427EC
MDESVNHAATLITLILFFGGLGAMVIVRRTLRAHPVETQRLVPLIARRAYSPKQFAGLAAALLALYFLAGCTGVLFFDGYIPEEQKPLIQLAAQWIIYALFAAVLLVVNRRGRNRFGLALKNFKWWWAGVGFYFAIIPVIMAASFVYHELISLLFGIDVGLQEVARHVRGDWNWLQVGFVFTAVVGAPVYEEIVFRGILFPLILKHSNIRTAMIFTAVLFAAVHLHIPSLLPIALLSVFLCYAYLRTQSLWACIGIHMMFNGISIFVLNIMG